jgi:hypothetical protein
MLRYYIKCYTNISTTQNVVLLRVHTWVIVCLFFFSIEYISMPHYLVILHALRFNVHNVVTD